MNPDRQGRDVHSLLLDHNDQQRPSKRVKGTITREYLDLLNIEIQDSAFQYVPDDGRSTLPASQIGLISWTSTEKEIFFEALSRLGRDDVPGIASRIRTKGVMEVRQYMKLLDDALTQRKQHNELASLELVDFPAAVEIGTDCSDILEDAADALAGRQENHEEGYERQKWGDDFVLTTKNCEELEEELEEEDGQEHQSSPFTLFHLPVWLKLSETVFLNSAQEDNNWEFVSDERPSIRLTALEDFHSLALSMTTRLITSASYITESRIRAKRALYPTKTRDIVKRRDMEAAIASLGLTPTRTNFWGKCPRRLGLHVYEERPHRKDTQVEPFTYDEVEQELGVKDDIGSFHSEWEGSSISSDSSLAEDIEGKDDVLEDETSIIWNSEDEDVKDEANEVLLHSAVDRPQTTRERQTLVSRIKAEREQETCADVMDAHATYKEEKRMWNLLGKQPPEPLEKPTVQVADRRTKGSVGDVYSTGQDWRQHTQYFSEWEYDFNPHG